MQNLLKSIIPSFAAFYTICSAFSAYADEAKPPVQSLADQISASVDIEETFELVSDYIFLLREEGKSPAQCIESVLRLCKYDDVNKQFRIGPVFGEHWLSAFKGFSVSDLDSMTLLHRALSTLVSSSPQWIPRQSAEMLLKLAQQVNEIDSPTKEAQKLKTQTIWKLALIAQSDKEFGRQLGTLALEQMAKCSDISEGERRDALFRVTLSYSETHPLEAKDGDLEFRNVMAAAKILKSSKNKYDFEHLTSVYNQLRRRCTKEQTLIAQERLANAAETLNVEDKSRSIVLLQLGCAYFRAGKFDKAEEVFSKQAQKPIAQVCLAESLRKQKKYTKADQLLQKLAKTRFSFDLRYPSLYIGMANALRAQIFLDQQNYQKALPFLLAADTWFSNGVAQDNIDMRDFSFVDEVVPNDLTVLSNLELVYTKLGKKVDSQRISQIIAKVKREREINQLSVERDALILAAQKGGDTDSAVAQAKRVVEVYRVLEKDPTKRASLELDYAESLLRHSKTKSAEECIKALQQPTHHSVQLDFAIRKRIDIDEILIAEERGHTTKARTLLKVLAEKNQPQTLDISLRMSEAEARLALLTKDYVAAETKSRIVETTLAAQSKEGPKDYIASARDKFVNEHNEAIVDRIQALNQLQNYKQAAKLARVLLVSNNSYNDRVGADAAAQLAFSYSQDGHDGLARSMQHDAAYRNRASFPMEPSRYEADSKETLAILCEKQENLIRSRRYRSEAKDIREKLQQQQCSLSTIFLRATASL